VTIITAVVALFVGAMVMGFHGIVMIAIGGAIAAQGLLLERVTGESTSISRITSITGAAVASVSAHLWFDGQGTVIALAGLAALLVASGHSMGKRSLLIAALVILAVQAMVLGIIHPAWSRPAQVQWFSWAAVAFVGAIAMHWMRHRLMKPSQLEIPRWTEGSLVLAEVLYAIGAASTALVIFVGGGPWINLLWLVTGAFCWIVAAQRKTTGFHVAAVILLCAAVVKLLAFDWLHFTGTTRVLLVFLTGITLLFGPLWSARRAAEMNT
jgi:hypothetical protein